MNNISSNATNFKRISSVCFSLISLIFLTSCVNPEQLKAEAEKVSQQEKTFQATQAQLETEMNAKDKVVFVKKKITAGGTIAAADVGEREMDVSETPIDALSSKSQAIGRKVKRGFAKDDIVCQHQLVVADK